MFYTLTIRRRHSRFEVEVFAARNTLQSFHENNQLRKYVRASNAVPSTQIFYAVNFPNIFLCFFSSLYCYENALQKNCLKSVYCMYLLYRVAVTILFYPIEHFSVINYAFLFNLMNIIGFLYI